MSDFAYQEKKVSDLTVKVTLDEYSDVDSPREWGMSSKMWTKKGRYLSPDEKPTECVFESLAQEFGIEEPNLYVDSHESFIKKISKFAVILPVFRYEHGGIAYSTSSFSCTWDSGQAGFIFMKKEDIRKEYNVKNVTKKVIEQVVEHLKGQVEDYSMWANGQVYEYSIYDKNDDLLSSCGGFLGDTDDCLSEGIEVANHIIADYKSRRLDRLKQLIINNVPYLNRSHELGLIHAEWA